MRIEIPRLRLQYLAGHLKVTDKDNGKHYERTGLDLVMPQDVLDYAVLVVNAGNVDLSGYLAELSRESVFSRSCIALRGLYGTHGEAAVDEALRLHWDGEPSREFTECNYCSEIALPVEGGECEECHSLQY